MDLIVSLVVLGLIFFVILKGIKYIFLETAETGESEYSDYHYIKTKGFDSKRIKSKFPWIAKSNAAQRKRQKAWGPLWSGISRKRTKIGAMTYTKTYNRGKKGTTTFTKTWRSPTESTTYKNGKPIRRRKNKW